MNERILIKADKPFTVKRKWIKGVEIPVDPFYVPEGHFAEFFNGCELGSDTGLNVYGGDVKAGTNTKVSFGVSCFGTDEYKVKRGEVLAIMHIMPTNNPRKKGNKNVKK